MRNQENCEHELTDHLTNRCKMCGLQFLVCKLCTEAAGSGRNVLHAAPECHEFIFANA